MRKRKKLNEWCHAATCLRVSLAGKDVLQRFFDITQEDYFTQMEKENPQKVEQIKEQMTSLGCYSESLTIGETIWELFENCCIEDPRYYRAADCAADQNLRIYSTEKDWDAPHMTDIRAENDGESQVVEGIKEIKSSGVVILGNIVFDVVVIHENGEIIKNTGLNEVHVDNFLKNDVILIVQSQRMRGILYNEGIDSVENRGADFESIWNCIVVNQNREFINIPFMI